MVAMEWLPFAVKNMCLSEDLPVAMVGPVATLFWS